MAESLDALLEKALAASGAHSAQDAIVVALHASLLSEGFVCVAVGDQNFGEESTRTLPPLSTVSSPALPEGWNSVQDVYALQYKHERTRQACLVKIIPLGGQLLVNAVMANKNDEIHSVTLEVDKFTKSTSGSEFNSTSAFANLLQLMSTLNKEIITKLVESSQTSSSGKKDSGSSSRRSGREQEEDDPLRVAPPRQSRRPPDPLVQPGPFGFGDSDRLPFGVGGGGMVFDPLRQGGRPVGGFGPLGPYPPSHPPGARFDPVNPFGPGIHPPRRGRGGGGGGFYGPNPDHLPPPGYDDMFS